MFIDIFTHLTKFACHNAIHHSHYSMKNHLLSLFTLTFLLFTYSLLDAQQQPEETAPKPDASATPLKPLDRVDLPVVMEVVEPLSEKTEPKAKAEPEKKREEEAEKEAPAPVKIELTTADSDGDLIPDNEDPNPIVPDAPLFSWWVSNVTVGWDLDRTQVEKIEELTGEDTTKQRKTSFTVGGGFGGGGGASYGVNADPSAVFLSLLPGAQFLKSAGDDFKAQSHLAASFDLKAGIDKSKVVKEIRSEFQRLEKQRAIKNRHIEFTVEFFNKTPDSYKFTKFSIPVQTASRQTRAEALCYTAGKMTQDFEVPANRPTGYPVRFRAELSTTQSEQILDALEAGELNIAIDRANGRAINQTNQSDEIAQRQRISNFVEKYTSEVTFTTQENSTSWRVAKYNPTTGKPTTISEAIEAINQMAASANDKNYIETSGGVLYAVGSFRNTCRNAFEVTNAKKAPLKIIGWTRMNRYGPARNGKWEHLDRKSVV